MASLRQQGEKWLIRYRYPTGRQGKQHERGLGEIKEKEAKQIKATIERTLDLLQEGALTLPVEHPDVDDLFEFLRSGGRVQKVERPQVRDRHPLGKVVDEYKQLPQSLEGNSMYTETVHLGHLLGHLGQKKDLGGIRAKDLEDYVKGRLGDVAGATIKKELATFSKLWQYGVREGYASENIVAHVARPKVNEKPPFKTWDEIETKIKRGRLAADEVADLWECLFLRPEEIKECLADLKASADKRTINGGYPWFYPAIVFCACTGARRSEMMRAQIDDVHDGTVWLRGKKGDKSKTEQLRAVPLHPLLEKVLPEWLEKHPGGQHLFVNGRANPLTPGLCVKAFERIAKGTKWEVLRGYHVFRHSFASNLARTGKVPLYRVMEYCGHTVEATARRYRHLFPEDKKADLEALAF